MPSDDQPPFNRFDDPPMTVAGVMGALGLLILAAIMIGHWTSVATTLCFVVDNLLAMAPIILFAVALAAALRASGADTALAAAVRARPAGMVLAGAAVGAVTPICGVGALPLVAGLLRSGVPLAPVMAFWLASPITDPAMLAITAATLGLGFAIGKTVLSFAIGIAGGLIADRFARRGWFAHPLRGKAIVLADSACPALPLRRDFWRERERLRLFATDARASLMLIMGWLAAAFAVESLIRTHLPAELVAGLVGEESFFAVPFAVAVAAPIYVDGYGALPLVRGLMDLGMTSGAAMGFLLAGGIVSLYASIAVFALVRLPVFILYVGLALGLSLVGALAFGAISG